MDREKAVLASARAQMMYDANRKSTGVAYLLWLFLGSFGAHRFYLGATATGGIQLMLLLLGWLPLFVGWMFLGIWLLIDLFLIPGIARDKNMAIVDRFDFD